MSDFQQQLLQDRSTDHPTKSRCGILRVGAEVVFESYTPPQMYELQQEIWMTSRVNNFSQLGAMSIKDF